MRDAFNRNKSENDVRDAVEAIGGKPARPAWANSTCEAYPGAGRTEAGHQNELDNAPRFDACVDGDAWLQAPPLQPGGCRGLGLYL